MADPVTLAMVGAAAGAALKPKNPLQGAMLGATAGFTGGTALGIGAAGAAGAAGTAAGTAGAAGAAGTAANTALAGQMAAQPALSYAGGNIANAAASALPSAATNAAGLSFAGMSPSAANVANTAPSFMDKLGMAGKSAYENPMMTAQALNATQGLLTPEQQPPSAPAVPVQKGQLRDYNPMASMDPYRQSVIGGQPISLI
jgi:hypothetical protein